MMMMRTNDIIYSKEEILTQKFPYVILDRNLHPCDSPKIRVALHTTENKLYAAKKVAKWALNEIQWNNLHRGISIHKYLCSFGYPGIVPLVDVVEDERCFYLVMQPLDGDLVTLIEKRQRLDEEEARSVFKKTLDIVQFIHSHRVCHRDLKADNFLFRWDPEDHNKVMDVLLTDFDFSDYISDQPFFVPCGSPAYTAPEVCILNPSFNGEQADIWSIGVLLYTLVCGEFPWYHPDLIQLFTMIKNDPVLFPSYLSGDVVDLLQKMLTKDPQIRIFLQDIFEHPWLQKPSIPKGEG